MVSGLLLAYDVWLWSWAFASIYQLEPHASSLMGRKSFRRIARSRRTGTRAVPFTIRVSEPPKYKHGG